MKALFCARIAAGTLVNNRLIAHVIRAIHLQWAENVLMNELLITYTADLLNDHAKQMITRVVVEISCPWLEVEGNLAEGITQGLGRHIMHNFVWKPPLDGRIAFNARCMGQQVVNGNLMATGWIVG